MMDNTRQQPTEGQSPRVFTCKPWRVKVLRVCPEASECKPCPNKVPLVTRHRLRNSEAKAKGEEKSNRDNPKFKNRRNLMQPNDIPKVNRDKNTTSTSPHFRRSLTKGDHFQYR